ncbi:MAG TPA: quinone oxidoreductase [Terriglobales bacterium]|nr:quinone oxidoreductase [Terriglobales bacterium]
MKAIQVSKTGGPEALQYVDLPVPKPKPNEALVKIESIGVNFIDVYFREGRYPAQTPFIVGREMAGTVTEVGSEVRDLQPGDRVAQTSVMGSYAEYQCVPEAQLVKVPDQITSEQAAAVMLQGATVHYLVRSTYPLKSEDTLLLHAAAGGVGLLLAQFAKRIGARVVGTVSTEEKAKLAREAGVDDIILYTQQDFVAETKRLTGGKGVDVVYDGVGKTTFEGSLSVLKPRGYMVLFGASSGAVPPFDPIRLSQMGSLFLTRPNLVNYIATREELQWRMTEVFNMMIAGDLKVHVGQRYKLSDAPQAHRDLEGRKTTGKVILQP